MLCSVDFLWRESDARLVRGGPQAPSGRAPGPGSGLRGALGTSTLWSPFWPFSSLRKRTFKVRAQPGQKMCLEGEGETRVGGEYV